MKTILLSNHYEGKPLTILRDAVGGAFTLKVLRKADRDELLNSISEADYLLMSGRLGIDREVIDRAGKLRMIQRTGVGLDNVDLEYLCHKGIPLYVNRGINANSAAEYTVMLMLAALKRNYAVNSQMRSGIWKKQETALTTHEMYGKTVGLIGMGNIGTRVARMLSGFDAKIIYTDIRRLPFDEEDRLGAVFCDFEELLCKADIISLHCPYDAAKGYLIAEKEIEQMKDGVVLINTARGKLVRQKAVEEALEKGKIAAVGFDVFEEEPLCGGEALLESMNAYLSPHIAGLSYETFTNMMVSAVENIKAFDRGELASIAGLKVQRA